jgi:hypothetical protein
LRIIAAAFFFLVVGPLWHLLATRVPLTFSRNGVGFQTLSCMPLEPERAEAYRRKAAEYLLLAEHARKLVLLWDISNSRRGGEIWPMKSSGWIPEHGCHSASPSPRLPQSSGALLFRGRVRPVPLTLCPGNTTSSTRSPGKNAIAR